MGAQGSYAGCRGSLWDVQHRKSSHPAQLVWLVYDTPVLLSLAFAAKASSLSMGTENHLVAVGFLALVLHDRN